MNFELTDEQQMIQAAAREFAQNEIAPVAATYDASGEFPVDTIRKAGELGFVFVDLIPPLQKAAAELQDRELLYNPANVHWTIKGNRVVAEALARAIHDFNGDRLD